MQGKLLFTIMLLLLPLQGMARQPVSIILYVGGEFHDVDYQFNGPLVLDPSDDGDSYGLGLAYDIDRRWQVVLDWTSSDADDVDINNATVGVNYRIPLKLTNLYAVVGGFVGEGKLDWQADPAFIDPFMDELKSRESAYGLNLALAYDLRANWSTSLSYRYFLQEYKTHAEIAGERLEFQHDNMQMILFGLHYHF